MDIGQLIRKHDKFFLHFLQKFGKNDEKPSHGK